MNFSYLSKIVLGLAIAFFPLLSHADTIVGLVPNEIALSKTMILMPVFLSAVLLFAFRKKKAPVSAQKKQNEPCKKTPQEKKVLKLTMGIVIWNLILALLYQTGTFSDLGDYEVLYLYCFLIGMGIIFALIGFYLFIETLVSMPLEKHLHVRAKHWICLFVICLLAVVHHVAFVFYLDDLELLIMGIELFFMMALSVGLIKFYKEKQTKENVSSSEQCVFKISRFFLSLNLVSFVLIALFSYNEDFLKYLRWDYLILGIISICVIVALIGFVLGLLSQVLKYKGYPTKVRSKYWAGLCLSALLTSVFYAHVFGTVVKNEYQYPSCNLFTKKGIHCCWHKCPFISEEEMYWHNQINGFEKFE